MLSSRAKRASDGKEDGKLSLSASVISDVDTQGFARRSVSEMYLRLLLLSIEIKSSDPDYSSFFFVRNAEK